MNIFYSYTYYIKIQSYVCMYQRTNIIMFLFLFITLTNIITAVPLREKWDMHADGTTAVPKNLIDRLLVSHVKKSSKHLPESVQALQSAIQILFPSSEKNASHDRQVLLIGCLINKDQMIGKQRRGCRGLHEKHDKNVFYEFDDNPLNEHLPIHVEHINVARVEKSMNDTSEGIRKLIASDPRLLGTEPNEEKTHPLEAEKEHKKGLLPWFFDKHRISTTTASMDNYSMNEQNNDADFAILDQQSTYLSYIMAENVRSFQIFLHASKKNSYLHQWKRMFPKKSKIINRISVCFIDPESPYLLQSFSSNKN